MDMVRPNSFLDRRKEGEDLKMNQVKQRKSPADLNREVPQLIKVPQIR
jgi:hypothetical protein